jgi:hypothetical protein
MSKVSEYQESLKGLKDWTPFLMKNSGLPGPRGNLELAQVVAEEGSFKQFEKFLSYQAEENTPEVFLVFCGVAGLGKLIASGNVELFPRLRAYASDSRWRIREGVAIGLQYVGDRNMKLLLNEMQAWSRGNWYEKRAVGAALAEPRLLKDPKIVTEVIKIFDQITSDVELAGHPKDDAFKVLRQGLGYCWSVAVAALPIEGKPVMEKWVASKNPDVQWIMKENLKKNRLIKMDATWVKTCQARLRPVL